MTASTAAHSLSPGTAVPGAEDDETFYGEFTGEDQKAVLSVPLRIRAAWAANDADTFADTFTDDGSLLMQDTQLTSREEIRAYMAARFAGAYRGASVTGAPLSVRFLRPDVAVVITEGGILLPGDTEVDADRQILAMWVIVERAGRWLLLSHQSSPVRG